MPAPTVVVVVEDELGLSIVERLLAFAWAVPVVARPLVMRGITNIKRDMPKYRNACKVVPHCILVDLDQVPCAPNLLTQWNLSDATPGLLFRVAVREAEAWLLADRSGFASFSGVPTSKLPIDPESVVDPKRTLINIVRNSRNRRLATELVPKQGSRVSIGPLYNERLSHFVRTQWNVETAADVAPSLSKMIGRLRDFP